MISDARNSGTETTNVDTRCGTTRDLDTTEPAPWQTLKAGTKMYGSSNTIWSPLTPIHSDSPRPETETDLERTRRGGRPSSAFEGSGGGLFNGTGNGGRRRGAGCRKALQRAVVQDGRKVSRSSSQEQEQSSPMHAANLAKAKVHLGNFNENRIPSTHAVVHC
ncbi:hypothetical protein HZH68_000902 [Vespula germanica]|uniref:Uncharacterized protein n=2 Tax=Vespula TaxID=7451 RepID=A0A834U674_VESGE|nr:hypothetical protein HZH68_000902 [Vespula germanica]KAF7438586.1 hypothetical protein H0235_000977 [Vespula pensylvanica]